MENYHIENSFHDYLRFLIKINKISGTTKTITQKVIDEGESSLNKEEYESYQTLVLDELATKKCNCCGELIPRSELMSSLNSGICSRCTQSKQVPDKNSFIQSVLRWSLLPIGGMLLLSIAQYGWLDGVWHLTLGIVLSFTAVAISMTLIKMQGDGRIWATAGILVAIVYLSFAIKDLSYWTWRNSDLDILARVDAEDRLVVFNYSLTGFILPLILYLIFKSTTAKLKLGWKRVLILVGSIFSVIEIIALLLISPPPHSGGTYIGREYVYYQPRLDEYLEYSIDFLFTITTSLIATWGIIYLITFIGVWIKRGFSSKQQ